MVSLALGQLGRSREGGKGPCVFSTPHRMLSLQRRFRGAVFVKATVGGPAWALLRVTTSNWSFTFR